MSAKHIAADDKIVEEDIDLFLLFQKPNFLDLDNFNDIIDYLSCPELEGIGCLREYLAGIFGKWISEDDLRRAYLKLCKCCKSTISIIYLFEFLVTYGFSPQNWGFTMNQNFMTFYRHQRGDIIPKMVQLLSILEEKAFIGWDGSTAIVRTLRYISVHISTPKFGLISISIIASEA